MFKRIDRKKFIVFIIILTLTLLVTIYLLSLSLGENNYILLGVILFYVFVITSILIGTLQVIKKHNKDLTILKERVRNIQLDDKGIPEISKELQEIYEEVIKARRALVHSEKRFQDVVSAFDVFVWEIDAEGRFTYVSDQVTSLNGHHPSEFLGKRVIDVANALDENFATEVLDTIKNRRPFRNMEYERYSKSGDIIWQSTSGIPIYDHNNQFIGYRGATRDITRKRKAEEALKESRESYRRLVEYSPDGIIVHYNKKVVYINQAGVDMFGGTSSSDIVDRPLLDLFPVENKGTVNRSIENSYKNREFVYRYNQTCLRLDGKKIYLEVSGIPIDYKGNEATLAMFRDITEQKLNEELLRKSEKLSVVGQLSAGIAHEIRNPLTSVKGFLQLLQKEIVTSDIKDKGRYLEIILSELDRVEAIIHEFLFIARPNHDIVFKEESIVTIMKQVKTLLDSQAILHNVQILLKVDRHISTIHCEQSQLKQVFINIIQNGIEAMPMGGTITIEIKNVDNGRVGVYIKDEGKGISKERIKKLGEPFYSTKEKGTGLGLMISYKIIETHCGKIDVESILNEGTIFKITLPINPQNEKVEKLAIKEYEKTFNQF